MTGRTVGHYRIVGQLGRGGSGTVYHAVDETLNRDVAIKVLNPHLADSDALKRFRAEATILARLHHPDIATIYELFQSETDLLMVMEFVHGEPLDKLCARVGPLPPDRAAYLIERILSPLAHAHRAGVVHRDMKPANVMVTDAGDVKIMDFGIARVLNAEQITVDGSMLGTPAYMSPEQALSQDVDARSDLYSVGVMLYWLLADALPFEAETPFGILQRKLSNPPTPLCFHGDGFPDWCDAILRRALARSPAERFQTADAFREALAKASGIALTAPVVPAVIADAGVHNQLPVERVDTERVAVMNDEPEVLPAISVTCIDESAPSFVESAASDMEPLDSQVIAREASDSPVPGPGEPLESAPVDPDSSAPRALAKRRPRVMRRAKPVDWTEPLLALFAVAAVFVIVVAAWRRPADSRITPAPPAIEVTSAAASSGGRPAVAVAAPSPAIAAAAAPASVVAPGPPEAVPHPTEAAPPRAPLAAAPAPAAVKNAFGRLVFDTKTLVPIEGKQRLRDAKLTLGPEKINVTAEEDPQRLLYSLPYRSVTSIHYSRGRDPMWRSPEGPALVARAEGGVRAAFGLGADRRWISLGTITRTFIVLCVNDDEATRILSALESRTGLTQHRVADQKRKDRL